MSAIERLDAYLDTLRRRLRTHIYVRGTLLAVGAVLLFVVAFSWLLQRSGFDEAFAIAGRVLIGIALVAIAAVCFWLPLRILRRDDGARVFERKLPHQQGRLSTYLDTRRGAQPRSALIELLAEDAVEVAAGSPVDEIVPPRKIRLNALAAFAALCALGALLTLAPERWSYTSRHLLLGTELPRELVPVRSIAVRPGDVTVRRNSDLAITASVRGFDPAGATVFVRFADRSEWERAPMQRGDAGTFEFNLYALRSPLTYYVDADGTRSKEHRVTLADLPRIERVRLTYEYPKWTGLASEVDEGSRDIRAVAGTQVTIEIESDAPLENAVLVHDGKSEALAARGSASVGMLAIEKPGTYHIAANVAGERVALSDEYAIEIVPDEKPTVQIERPGRDWRATNIEEVPVRVRAQDDFRLRSVELHYSINGGEWRSLPLARGVKESREQTLLELEKLGGQQKETSGSPLLAPGDLISYYAVAKDHKRSVQTDLFMVQVQPFERRFLQQNAGNGGGIADEQGAISERQREILLATWNLQRSDSTKRQSREQLQANAKMLSDMQATLAQQARTLATRTRARAQVESDERIRHFVESLERAAVAMDPAAAHLSAYELEKAVPVEQQALQQLLRAEAAFREVQVSMQNDSGGQGSQAARDFGEMFELEMDVEKSQYESEAQLSEANTDKEMEEALRKLKELAERQEQLAEEAKRNQQLTPEQRWRQEQLRREAEDLRRRLAALNRQQQSQSNQRSDQQSQSGQQSEQQGSEQQQASNEGSSQGSSRGARRQNGSQSALESVDEALSEMQAANAGQQQSAEDQVSSAREASQKLREAVKRLDRPSPTGLDESLERLADRAGELASEQRQIQSDLYDAVRESGEMGPLSPRRSAIDPARAQALVEGKQQLAEQLGELQKDLRNSVHRHRGADKGASRQLAEIVNDLEASELMYRMRRSAAEIYYGRARDAAAREDIITESLENLEKDLREASVRAAKDGSKSPSDAPATERLLAEVAELRRRVEHNERLQDIADPNAESEAGAAPERGESPRASGQPSGDRGPSGAERALSAWDPISPNARMPEGTIEGSDSLARQSTSIAERARRLRERAGNRELTAQELAALREMARELRHLAGDPLAAEAAAMKSAVAQLELTALAAVANARRGEPARTSVPIDDSPQYRETVAEYYRRLGGG